MMDGWVDVVINGKSHSGCRAFDLAFTEPCSCTAIQFNNKHSYSITLLFQSEGLDDWQILLWNYVLMTNPHSTGKDAETWFIVLSESFLHKGVFTRLRILLQQPSPHWKEFGITNFSLVCTESRASTKIPIRLTHTCTEPELGYEVNLLNIDDGDWIVIKWPYYCGKWQHIILDNISSSQPHDMSYLRTIFNDSPRLKRLDWDYRRTNARARTVSSRAQVWN